MRKWRQTRRAPLGKKIGGKFAIPVCSERLIERMFRKIGLHNDFSPQLRASGPAGNLEQQRCKTLGGAKIGAVERIVGAEHPDQSEAGEIVTLGEHLRAHENVDGPRVDSIANFRKGAAAFGAVAIDARNSRRRETLGERSL